MKNEILTQLKEYFSSQKSVALAFLFGSQASGRQRASSDWDVAVYFKSPRKIELESTQIYPEEGAIHAEIERLTGSEVDLVALNRARPPLVFSILNKGFPLAIKDHSLYLRLLSQTHYEAVDFWQFVRDFWKIREEAASLTPEARALLIEHLTFLENELADLPKFQRVAWEDYTKDSHIRRDLERWIENLVMASLDIAKIILASDKKSVPQTYRETLRIFATQYMDKTLAEHLSATVDMRNIVAHEYLDIRWERIREFIDEANKIYPPLIEKVKRLVT